MKASRRAARILGYALSIACIAALAASVDWARFVAHFEHASLWLLAAAVPLTAATYGLFAWRWRLLLAFERRLPLWRVFGYLMLGYLANVVFPLRAGDALRVVLVRQAYGHGATRVAGSIAVERMLDVLTLLAIGAAIVVGVEVPSALSVALRAAAVLAFGALALIIAIAARPHRLGAAVGALARRLKPRVASALAAHATQLSEALSILWPRDRVSVRRTMSAVALTLVGWASYALAMTLCTAAFDVEPAGRAALLLIAATNLGSAIPSSPASLGVYHALGVLALSVWHVGIDLALSVATATHAVTVGVQVTLGLLAMRRLRAEHLLADARTSSDRGS